MNTRNNHSEIPDSNIMGLKKPTVLGYPSEVLGVFSERSSAAPHSRHLPQGAVFE